MAADRPVSSNPLLGAKRTLTWHIQPRDLAPLTTLELGGPADHYVEAEGLDEVRDCLAAAREDRLPLTVLGGGSNVVIADDGVEGVVLHLVGARIECRDTGRVYASAATPWDDVVAFCVDSRLAGLEGMSGIPGQVGAAPIQNIGAYGQELADRVVAIHAIDRRCLDRVRLPASACAFGYRSSIFKREARDRYVIVGIELDLVASDTASVRYGELEDTLGAKRASLKEIRDAVVSLRARKSMVLRDGDPNRRSVGSFFINPAVEKTALRQIAERAGAPVPHHVLNATSVKLSAAWLIERAGFHKGTRRGAVGISSAHALALVNHGGARAAELRTFAEEIQRTVFDDFAVKLEFEPTWLGRF